MKLGTRKKTFLHLRLTCVRPGDALSTAVRVMVNASLEEDPDPERSRVGPDCDTASFAWRELRIAPLARQALE